MVNMAYCRFQNTSTALSECVADIAEKDNWEEFARSLSEADEEELAAAKKLYIRCQKFINLYNQLKENDN